MLHYFIFNPLKGEGLNNLKVEGGDMVVTDQTAKEINHENITGDGLIDVLEKPRPASATPGDNISTTSSVNTSNDVTDQSPARSPHARSWTVPGGLEFCLKKKIMAFARPLFFKTHCIIIIRTIKVGLVSLYFELIWLPNYYYYLDIINDILILYGTN